MEMPITLPAKSIIYAFTQPIIGIAPSVNIPPGIGGQTIPIILIKIKTITKITKFCLDHIEKISKYGV